MRPLMFASILTLLITAACSPSDSCENTICLNDGICNDGICDCPERFTGPNCQEQVAPDKIILQSVSVTRFPASQNDAAWDGSDDPDIFFRLYDEEGPLAQPISVIENADPQNEHMFLIQSMYLFNVDQIFSLRLLDYEGAGMESQDMGIIHFQLYQNDNGFPETIVIDDGGPLAFILQVQYVFNHSGSGS